MRKWYPLKFVNFISTAIAVFWISADMNMYMKCVLTHNVILGRAISAIQKTAYTLKNTTVVNLDRIANTTMTLIVIMEALSLRKKFYFCV